MLKNISTIIPFLLSILTFAFSLVRAETPSVHLTYIAHSTFLIESSDGKRILTDPFSDGLGYVVPQIPTDFITISHGHHDHNNEAMGIGNPMVIRELGEYREENIFIRGTLAYHGRPRTSEQVILYSITVDGITFCHLGDLGGTLSEEQLESIGQVDILFLPAVSPMEPEDADIVVKQINPRIVILIHYRTDAMLPRYGSPPPDEFLEGKDNVIIMNESEMELSKDTLPEETQIIVMKYSAEKAPR